MIDKPGPFSVPLGLTPLFRLGWIPFTAKVALDYRSTALFVLFTTLCGISLTAEGINAVLLRRRQAQR